MRGGEYSHVFAGAPQSSVEFIGSMHPHGRKALGDGVIGHDDFYLEGTARAVRSGFTRARIGNSFAVLDIPQRPGVLVATAPAADADHAIELRPFSKGVVGGMHDNQAATVLDIAGE